MEYELTSTMKSCGNCGRRLLRPYQSLLIGILPAGTTMIDQ